MLDYIKFKFKFKIDLLVGDSSSDDEASKPKQVITQQPKTQPKSKNIGDSSSDEEKPQISQQSQKPDQSLRFMKLSMASALGGIQSRSSNNQANTKPKVEEKPAEPIKQPVNEVKQEQKKMKILGDSSSDEESNKKQEVAKPSTSKPKNIGDSSSDEDSNTKKAMAAVAVSKLDDKKKEEDKSSEPDKSESSDSDYLEEEKDHVKQQNIELKKKRKVIRNKNQPRNTMNTTDEYK